MSYISSTSQWERKRKSHLSSYIFSPVPKSDHVKSWKHPNNHLSDNVPTCLLGQSSLPVRLLLVVSFYFWRFRFTTLRLGHLAGRLTFWGSRRLEWSSSGQGMPGKLDFRFTLSFIISPGIYRPTNPCKRTTNQHWSSNHECDTNQSVSLSFWLLQW